jgi:hypothetical protein
MVFLTPIMSPEEYKTLVEETLGAYLPHAQHNVIVGKEDEKTVMICNCFQYGTRTMFLHHCWFAEEYQKKIRKLKYWQAFCDYVATIGYDDIMGVIDARNIPAIIWALKTGWTITGTRQDRDGHIIVNVLKVLREAMQ